MAYSSQETHVSQLTGNLKYDKIMWLALCSVKSRILYWLQIVEWSRLVQWKKFKSLLLWLISINTCVSKGGDGRGNSYSKKWRDIWMKGTQRLYWNISKITDVNQKNVNVCKHMVKMAPHIYSLLIDKDVCDCGNISVKFPCAYVCLSSRDLFIFFLFLLLCYPYFSTFPFRVNTFDYLFSGNEFVAVSFKSYGCFSIEKIGSYNMRVIQ